MQRSILIVVTAAALLQLAAATIVGQKEQVTPVQKVIELMEDLLAKGKEEKHKEELQYSTYKQFCEDTTVEKKKAIAKAESTIESLNADIQYATAHAELLSNQMDAHQADVASWQTDQQNATTLRNTEHADYEVLHKNYSESIDALERAIQTLKEQDYNRPQASEAQLQAVKKVMPPGANKYLDLYMAKARVAMGQAPEAHGYEFQSREIIAMFEELLAKFQDERTSLEKEEANNQHNHDMLMQDLTASIDTANHDTKVKTMHKSKALQAKASKAASLAQTTAEKDDDENYLADLTATCSKKATDYESRQALRADEIAAIEQAIEIMSGESVTGKAEKHLPTMLQTYQQRALVSLRARLVNLDAQKQVHLFLEQQAQRLQSSLLTNLASKIRDDDPFAKVKQMIEDLILRLQEEASDEASHKSWCDSELATNNQTRTEMTANIESLTADIDLYEANIAKLTAEIAKLTEEVAALDKAMEEATDLRAKEKATNEEAINDAKEAQAAVTQATGILRDLYDRAGTATAFVQQVRQQPVAPEIFESPYTGMQAEAEGIFGILEVVLSDFERLEAETRAAEDAGLEEYNKFITDSTTSKNAKNSDIESKTSAKVADETSLSQAREDRDGNQKELDAANAYYDQLVPSCVDPSVEYEDRVARREAEIQSLNEALKILGGETIQ